MTLPPETPPAMVSFTFDGTAYRGRDGQPLAVALLVAGRRVIRTGTGLQGMRGAFCLMGICQECVVLVDGRRVESCRLPVHEGLTAEPAP